MFVATGCNVYIHIRSEKINEYYNENLKEDVMVIKGRNVTRQLTDNYSRQTINNVPVTIMVRGYLKEYVKNEIDEGDNLFIVGYIIGRYDGRFTSMSIRAEAIYKEDFVKYFPKDIQQKGILE